MQQRAGETAGRARDSKFQQEASIDVSAHRPEALRGTDEVWHRDGRDRKASIDLKGQHRRQQAADAETRNRSYASRDNTGDCDDDCVQIQSRGCRSGQGARSS